MSTGLEVELFEASVLELKDSISRAPKRTRRMLLRSLLIKFGFKVRTQERIQRLTIAFSDAGILVTPAISECDRDGWVTFSLKPQGKPLHSDIDPQDTWFDEVAIKEFATEKEVEIRFIVPLLERLGFNEDDRADGFPIEIVVGSKRTMAEADFVLFDGRNRSMDNALLIVEAKRTTKRVKDFISQARSYAMFLGTPFYLVTNGDDIQVFRYQSPLEADRLIFTGERISLKNSFAELFRIVGKPHAIANNLERRKRKK